MNNDAACFMMGAILGTAEAVRMRRDPELVSATDADGIPCPPELLASLKEFLRALAKGFASMTPEHLDAKIASIRAALEQEGFVIVVDGRGVAASAAGIES